MDERTLDDTSDVIIGDYIEEFDNAILKMSDFDDAETVVVDNANTCNDETVLDLNMDGNDDNACDILTNNIESTSDDFVVTTTITSNSDIIEKPNTIKSLTNIENVDIFTNNENFNECIINNVDADNDSNTNDDDDDDYDDNVIITINPTISNIAPVMRVLPNAAILENTMSTNIEAMSNLSVENQTNMEIDNLNNVVNGNDLYAQSIAEDLAIQQELRSLVSNSIILSSTKCITVKYGNQIILIPSTTEISNRLRTYFWAYPKKYMKQSIPNGDEFNQMLRNGYQKSTIGTSVDLDEVTGNNVYTSYKYAVFSTKYKKNMITATVNASNVKNISTIPIAATAKNHNTNNDDTINNHTSSSMANRVMSSDDTINTIRSNYMKSFVPQSSTTTTPPTQTSSPSIPPLSTNLLMHNNTNNKSNTQILNDGDTFKRSNIGIYQYCDFAAVIIENGQIIDYAIHGFASNISEMIYHHQPKYIYYNAQEGDALDIFMNYKHQPFYMACYGKLRPIRINRINDFFNPLVFCERNDLFCALCNCLRDVRGLFFKIPEQKFEISNTCNMNTPQMYKISTNYPKYTGNDDDNNEKSHSSPNLMNAFIYRNTKYQQSTTSTRIKPHHDDILRHRRNSSDADSELDRDYNPLTNTRIRLPRYDRSRYMAYDYKSLHYHERNQQISPQSYNYHHNQHRHHHQQQQLQQQQIQNEEHMNYYYHHHQPYNNNNNNNNLYNQRKNTNITNHHHHHHHQQQHEQTYQHHNHNHHHQQPKYFHELSEKYQNHRRRIHDNNNSRHIKRLVRPIIRSALQQPPYNRRCRLQYAPKKPGTFNGLKKY